MAVIKSKPVSTFCNQGFTLLEIIATIVISSLLSLIIVQITTNNTTRSYMSLVNLNHELALQEVMEEITADYRLLLNSNLTPLVELQSRINEQRYWATKSYGADIHLNDNYCFEFVLNSGKKWQEGANLGSCAASENNLRVTLTYGNPATLSLTTIFSR